MKYFEQMIVCFFLLSIFILMIGLSRWMRLKYLQKLSKINILKRQKYKECRVFYSSFIIDKCMSVLFRHPIKNRLLIIEMVAGRPQNAAEIIKKQNYFLGTLLMGHMNARKSFASMKKNIKKWLNSRQFAVFFPLMAYQCFELDYFMKSINKIKDKMLPHKVKSYYYYICSYAYMQQADMLSASQGASLSLKKFIKKKYMYETIQSYILLGEIYRLSCVKDIANTMFEAALNIAQKNNISHIEAQISAMIGILKVSESRNSEARDKYNAAFKKATTETMKAEILSQIALLELSEDNLAGSMKKLKKSLDIFRKYKNDIGEAFNLQLLGHIKFKKLQYKKASEYFNKASAIYIKQKNYSAFMECLYTDALTQNKLKNNLKAEKSLRCIIDINHKYKNSFHIANAYNLLGLIFLEARDYQRSKVLFQQSLLLEQSNNRYPGIVIDYVDLALINELTENKENAIENLNIALDFARQIDDKELINIINKKINTLC